MDSIGICSELQVAHHYQIPLLDPITNPSLESDHQHMLNEAHLDSFSDATEDGVEYGLKKNTLYVTLTIHL